MAATITVSAGLAGYAALISEFPLRPIRDADDHRRALAVVRSLMGGGLDEAESDYLEVLVGLVEQYEEKTCPIDRPGDAVMLGFLLESRGVDRATLAHGAGLSESAIVAVLAGEAALGREQIGAIAGYFRISPAVFRFGGPGEAASSSRSS